MVYTANWVIICYLPPIKGTRNSYWLNGMILQAYKGRQVIHPPDFLRWFFSPTPQTRQAMLVDYGSRDKRLITKGYDMIDMIKIRGEEN